MVNSTKSKIGGKGKIIKMQDKVERLMDKFETPEKPCSAAVKMIWMKAYCSALVIEKEANAMHIADRAVEAYIKKFGA